MLTPVLVVGLACLAGSFAIKHQPCRVEDYSGNVIKQRNCTGGEVCPPTEAEPVIMNYRGGERKTFWCENPFGELRNVAEDACRAVTADNVDELEGCPQGLDCNVGPLRAANQSDPARYYLCGPRTNQNKMPCRILERDENRTVAYERDCGSGRACNANGNGTNWDIRGDTLSAYFCGIHRYRADGGESSREGEGDAGGRGRGRGRGRRTEEETNEEDEDDEDEDDRGEREPPRKRGRRGRGGRGRAQRGHRSRTGRRGRNGEAKKPKKPKTPV